MSAVTSPESSTSNPETTLGFWQRLPSGIRTAIIVAGALALVVVGLGIGERNPSPASDSLVQAAQDPMAVMLDGVAMAPSWAVAEVDYAWCLMGGVVYADRGEEAQGIDAVSGRVLWSHPSMDGCGLDYEPPETVNVGKRGNERRILIDPRTGKKRWRPEGKIVAWHGSTVFIATSGNIWDPDPDGLEARARKSGELKWRRTISSFRCRPDFAKVASASATHAWAVADRYCEDGGGYIRIARTGEAVGRGAWALTTVPDVVELSAGGLKRMDPRTGRVLWKWNVRGQNDPFDQHITGMVGGAILISGDVERPCQDDPELTCFGSYDAAIDYASGKTMWRKKGTYGGFHRWGGKPCRGLVLLGEDLVDLSTGNVRGHLPEEGAGGFVGCTKNALVLESGEALYGYQL